MIESLTTSIRSTTCGLLVAGFLRHVHAGRIYAGGNGFVSRQECPHIHGDELDDLSARLFGVLGLWFCDRLGQLVERAGPAGLVSRHSVPD